MDAYRLVLADDHPLVRQGIRRIIEEISGLAVVGEAGDGFELLRVLEKASPDMAIVAGTARNMNSVAKIAALLGDMA